MENQVTNYELLYQCFLSGQMSAGQLHEHMTEDQVFKAWIERRVGADRRLR